MNKTKKGGTATLTMNEVAAILGCSRPHLLKHIRNESSPLPKPAKFGRNWKYSKAAIENFCMTMQAAN